MSMFEKEDIFSTQIRKGSRKYFFDLKQNSKGDYYLKISEKKRRFDEGNETHQIMVFAEDIADWVAAFQQTIEEAKKLGINMTPSPRPTYEPDGSDYRQWTEEEDNRLAYAWQNGDAVETIAENLDRRIGAVLGRARKLGLTE